MKSKIALSICYVLLAICLAALVIDLGAYLVHIRLPDNIRLPLHVISFLWPLALALVAIFGWKPRTQPAAENKQNPTV
jgi:hypothetical protein